ncbi:hypothetical protein K443DRAFT_462647 [Laccaria amethystina LaAM-08-1]|uniref:Unplaced genomic scaffold K443scaffold_410, whole genome shotgun sequence n=1 Tax=Laccaria amethystina LaAM-08-1 TaxID=1095629 RepID=A0A0C9X6K2_9AGAR|nr:hypothetical protein K443DRAFT_462647 [Laccaria amethystina LaAM-08-1]
MSERNTPTLQHIFQAWGLCSEIRRRHCRGHNLHLAEIKMWPNSCLPSGTALITPHTGSQGRFTLDGVENHAAHYPREWGRRLEAKLTQNFIAKIIRLFGYITCHMLTCIRQNDTPGRCD